MSKKRKAPVDAGTSNKGRMGNGAFTQYESIIAYLFGQACVRVLKLNEKHQDEEGYGVYSLSLLDACISVYKYTGTGEAATVFNAYRSEVADIGLDTVLRNLIEVLDGEVGA